MEVTVINSRKGLCDMGDQHIIGAYRHSKFIHHYTVMVYHTKIKLLDQQVDFDIVYQLLFDMIFCIHQKLNKRGRVRINLKMRRVRVTIVAAESLNITYSECVSVAVVIQHVKRMRRTVRPYFSTLSHKWHDFRENLLNIKMCVLIFCITLYEIFLTLIRFQRCTVINLHRSSSEVPVILVRF